MDHSRAVAEALAALSARGNLAAAEVITRAYPFAPTVPNKRKVRLVDALGVFIRDGFIDRYTGQRLVFPGVLCLLSEMLPKEFPYHPNWKTDETHLAYWELFPTIDHLVPVSLGGADDLSNWVTTSMLRNAAKANSVLADLGWQLQPPGDMETWDGLLGAFLEYTRRHPGEPRTAALRRWRNAARAAAPRSS